ncbi:unnamed protein product [Bursaphelenchus xylophilus]|uniref:L-dopachrome isomerase n=1 Tax=Bursaphelenchus xylophilus TaxID=6326 RepID=A0A1I7SDS7_BURXY|nr:unnamed protein product [Bursaphelenchus xylophilus]CAG9084332.1 unnamed protein product [Bursaphelenchus xylophilus]
MPILKIATDLQSSQIPSDFLAKASSLVATLTGKPESYVQVVLNSNNAISFGGKVSSSAFVELGSIGGFGGKTNEIAEALTGLISSNLKIPKDRFYIKFTEIEASELSHNGSTF